MGTFTGGAAAEIITPAFVSATVQAVGGQRPSNADDTIFGGAGDDTIDGGKGDDFIDGGLGADLISGGDGADTIRWSPGSNSDVIDGGRGFDTLQFNTANIGETISVLDFGGHAVVTRDIAGITLDLTDVERITFGSAGGGADHFFIAGLGGTQVRQVDIDLATPDSLVDTVLVNGEAGADHIVLTGGAGSVSVAGLPATVQVSNGEAIDRAIVAGLDGDDTLDASALGGGMVVNFDGGMGEDVLAFKTGGADDAIVLASSSPTVEGQPIFADINGAVSQVNVTDVATTTLDTGGGADSIRASAYNAAANLVINAGDGADTVIGSARNDVIDGGRGDDSLDGGIAADTVSGGAGDDTVAWNPGGGSDVVDGGSGNDTLRFNTSNIGENISVLDFGGHAFVTRDIAGITLDTTSVERIAFGAAGGGADHYFLAGLGATDVKQVDIDLVTADSLIDTVLITGEAGADRIVVTGGAGSIDVAGLPAAVHVSHGEAIDYVAINALDGDDKIDVSALGGGMGLKLSGGAGADRFVFGPSQGLDVQISDFRGHAPGGEGDVIVLKGFADHTIAEAVANGHISQSGADVVVSDGSGPVITLQNTLLSQLGTGDFLFG